jgi:hypothetical protein
VFLFQNAARRVNGARITISRYFARRPVVLLMNTRENQAERNSGWPVVHFT